MYKCIASSLVEWKKKRVLTCEINKQNNLEDEYNLLINCEVFMMERLSRKVLIMKRSVR